MRRAADGPVRVLGPVLAGLAVALLRLTGRRAGAVLLYHAVSDRPGDPAREIVPPHDVRLLESQLRHLARWYRVVDAHEILTAVSTRRRGGRFPVAVTFDDDLPSHARLALPALRRSGVPATFFLCGASLDGPAEFWWERLQRAFDAGRTGAGGTLGEQVEAFKGLTPGERDAAAAEFAAGPVPDEAGMRAADVRAIAAAGMQIGFHTRRHDPLPSLDEDALAERLRAGRADIEALSGTALSSIAYPHGAHDERVEAAARDAGFQLGFSASGCIVSPASGPLAVPRIVPSHRSAGHLAVHLLFEVLGR
ncbi:MAG: polysaccharide deacetylase family protein [Gaiellaceae bacterium]